jgi:hypothetical protein
VLHVSPNFGDALEVQVRGNRVWFMPNKIIVGDFNDEWEVEEEYNISRVPNTEYQVDDYERLDDLVPPEASKLACNFFSNTYVQEGGGKGL